MAEDSSSPPPRQEGQLPFADALLAAVNQQKVPLFLFLLAYAMILAGAAFLIGPEAFERLLTPLSVLLVLGLAVWLVRETLSRRHSGPRVQGGRATIRSGASLTGAEIEVGSAAADAARGEVRGGSVEVGRGARVKESKIKVGGTKLQSGAPRD